MKILIELDEVINREELESLMAFLRSNTIRFKKLPPEIILYEPCFDIENLSYERQEYAESGRLKGESTGRKYEGFNNLGQPIEANEAEERFE